MLSKIGVETLKILKEKEKHYMEKDFSDSNTETNIEITLGSQCTYKEIKNNFDKYPYSSISATIMYLLDEKYIMTNISGKEKILEIKSTDNDTYRFIITDKGRSYLENLTYMKMSKYLPLSISVLSFLISLTGLIMQLIKWK
ncbi:hypothetical protein [Rummeliibacillus sp. TYF-LIM-RU47]|uniref:hypothetical protein n=1 Tax=Rummeliibacillus sp. TYF-LIM-RU47 TaxID=2608406 RepID=UPI0012397912|nr:hypothetical protein [Rummeliibacillus sp. TYF-LIM-RU47]